MTTLAEVLHRIDTLKPNSYSQSEKIRWISSLDSMIKVEIIDCYEGKEDVTFVPYTEMTDMTTELLIEAPFEEMYLYWLAAKIDYFNGEMAKYNNDITTYNELYKAYLSHYHRTHKPICKKTNFTFGW